MLLDLERTKRSGALDTIGPGARVRIFVEEGKVVLADESATKDTPPSAAEVKSKVTRALGWPSAQFSFFECHGGPLELAHRFGTPVEPLMIAALRLADREPIDELLGQARDRFAALRADLSKAPIDAFGL